VGHDKQTPRAEPMPDSLVVLDQLGADQGQLIGVIEGPESAMPFYPTRAPIDAYNSMIIDTPDVTAYEPTNTEA